MSVSSESLPCSTTKRRHGGNRPPKAVRERLMSKVSVVDPAHCWERCWEVLPATARGGYARLEVAGRSQYAHRLSWELFQGPVPDGLCVLHRCDNPPCVNPAHLFLGTIVDNNRDRTEKGRTSRHGAPRGEANPRARLTEAAVLAIRAEYRSFDRQRSIRALGRRYGVSSATVREVVKGVRWRHVA